MLNGIFINTDSVLVPYMYKNDLKTLQEIVKGHIEYIPLDEKLCMIVNEEGKIYNLKPNKAATRIVNSYGINDLIVGNALIVSTKEGDNDHVSIYQYEEITRRARSIS